MLLWVENYFSQPHSLPHSWNKLYPSPFLGPTPPSVSGSASYLLPPSGPGPQHTVSSPDPMRSNPASRPLTPSALALHEDRVICPLATHAACVLDLHQDSFPTLFSKPISSDDLTDGERCILPLLSHLVAHVHSLFEEVATLSTLRAAPTNTIPQLPPFMPQTRLILLPYTISSPKCPHLPHPLLSPQPRWPPPHSPLPTPENSSSSKARSHSLSPLQTPYSGLWPVVWLSRVIIIIIYH